MDSSHPVIVIDLTCDNDNHNGECIKRVVDTIFTRICPIDLVSSDDDEERTIEGGGGASQ